MDAETSPLVAQLSSRVLLCYRLGDFWVRSGVVSVKKRCRDKVRPVTRRVSRFRGGGCLLLGPTLSCESEIANDG